MHEEVFWQHYLSTDLVLDAESIPNLGYEHFFSWREKLRSWRFNVAYQVHYNDSFGIMTSRGDKVSIGVFQGPALRLGYSVYKQRNRKFWHNYFSVGLGMKYLFYDKVAVLTGKKKTEFAYKIQSENCLAVVPQVFIGSKHYKSKWCTDFFIGVQLHIKDRLKTIYYDQSSFSNVNANVPYSTEQLTVVPSLLVGINFGLVQMKQVNSTPKGQEKNVRSQAIDHCFLPLS